MNLFLLSETNCFLPFLLVVFTIRRVFMNLVVLFPFLCVCVCVCQVLIAHTITVGGGVDVLAVQPARRRGRNLLFI